MLIITTKETVTFGDFKYTPNLVSVQKQLKGAAVAQVCSEYKIPFSLISTIIYKANDNAILDCPKLDKEATLLYVVT